MSSRRPAPIVTSFLALAAGILATVASATSARAHTIDPYTFEELLELSEFAGVVECTIAGGVTAEYRAIETWKGDHEVGDTLRVSVAVNFWGPQFPITLVGERYVVTAAKSIYGRLMSYSSGSAVPLWWRNIRSDYQLPLFQGRARVDTGDEFRLGTTWFESLDDVRDAATVYLDGDDDARECAILRSIMIKSFRPDDEGVLEKLRAPTSTADLLTTLFALVDADTFTREGVGQIVKQYGQANTVAALDAMTDDACPFNRVAVLESIKKRMAEEERRAAEAKERREAEGENAEDQPEPPTEDEIREMRDSFKSMSVDDREFSKAFATLVEHDPLAVADWLVEVRIDAERDWRDADLAYRLVTYACHLCGKDHEAVYTRLLDAKDETIQVGGAIWLCFEDEEAGMEALRARTDLEGDNGVWAALTLARRGDRAAMRRALDVFEGGFGGGGAMSGVPHANLQRRVLVLLSNSAAQSGVAFPATPQGYDIAHKDLVAWWDANAESITLVDAWMAETIGKRID